jgi:hypothetical protein
VINGLAVGAGTACAAVLLSRTANQQEDGHV